MASPISASSYLIGFNLHGRIKYAELMFPVQDDSLTFQSVMTHDEGKISGIRMNILHLLNSDLMIRFGLI